MQYLSMESMDWLKNEKNEELERVVMYTLTYNSIPKPKFIELTKRDQFTFLILMQMKFSFLDTSRKSYSFYEAKNILLNKVETFKSKVNLFSLKDTVLNKIFRRCFQFYMEKLNMEKLIFFLNGSKKILKSVNKLFWYMFYNDCIDESSETQIKKGFNNFYQSFASIHHVDRKKRRRNETKSVTIKYLGIVIRERCLKNWLQFLKQNKIFNFCSSKFEEEILNEYFGSKWQYQNNSNIKISQKTLININVEKSLTLYLDKIKSLEPNQDYQIKNNEIKFFLRGNSYLFTLNDYLGVIASLNK